MTQIDIFDCTREEFHLLDKKIRLITLFSGYDSQALALKYLHVPFEHYKTCEWSIPSIFALYDMHFHDVDHGHFTFTDELCQEYTGNISKDYSNPLTFEQVKRLGKDKVEQLSTAILWSNNLLNITNIKGKDLKIVEKDKYNYIMTYSFPCQDLSLSGTKKGMAEGSGTRSSLLWEVGRILDELKEEDALPQMLLMENVPQVMQKQNIKEFTKWINKLEALGYRCYSKILNAKDYGVAQHRQRCYVVSLLGNYNYYFPTPNEKEPELEEILEKEVDEKYYYTKKELHDALFTNYWKGTLGQKMPRDEDGTMHTLQATDSCGNHVVAYKKKRENTTTRRKMKQILLADLETTINTHGRSETKIVSGGGRIISHY